MAEEFVKMTKDGQTTITANLPMATFYVWVKTPAGCGSTAFTAKLLQEAGIVTTPGVGLGQAGEGYIRMTLTVEEPRLEEALERLRKVQV